MKNSTYLVRRILRHSLLCMMACVLLVSCGGSSNTANDSEATETESTQEQEATLANESDSLRTIIASQLGEIEKMRAKFRVIAQELNEMIGEIPVATDDEGLDAESDRLEQKLDNLRKQLAEKSRLILELQQQHGDTFRENSRLSDMLSQLNEQISDYQDSIQSQLDQIVGLRQQLAELRTALAEKEEMIEAQHQHLQEQERVLLEQDRQLNRCFYLVGKQSELQELGIISGGVFKRSKLSKKGFDTSHFLTADMRELTSIPLNSKSADILSAVPEGSYELLKSNDKKLTLHILDPETFWSQSRYLVIRVK